jgi:hypothetical protein
MSCRRRDSGTCASLGDVRGYRYRDYGNRVGFWRLLEVSEKYGIAATRLGSAWP